MRALDTTRRRARRGFTLVEGLISITLLGLVFANVTMVLRMSSKTEGQDSSRLMLEDQARRVLDRIAFAVMGSDRESLFPDPASPTYSEELRYSVSLGVQDGEVVWSDPERIGLGQEDQAQLVWSENPDEEDERRVVWCNVIRPFLEGEVPNGVDDNGNGVIDERGLSFTLQGEMVSIRLCLERALSDGTVVTQTVETIVTCRN